MNKLEEVIRRNVWLRVGKRFIIDEDCTEQALLRLDVVRRSPAKNALARSGVLPSVQALGRIIAGGRDKD